MFDTQLGHSKEKHGVSCEVTHILYRTDQPEKANFVLDTGMISHANLGELKNATLTLLNMKLSLLSVLNKDQIHWMELLVMIIKYNHN
eukprot:Gb_12653 [translate_table: standard]